MDLLNVFKKLSSFFSIETESDKDHEDQLKNVTGEYYFLSIGIDNYDKEKDLDFSVKDSEYLFNVWVNNIKFNIKNKNIYKLYNHEATKTNIISNFERLNKAMSPNDHLVIQFSGHKFSSFRTSFFIPTDGDRKNIYSCISSYTINSYIEKIPAKKIVLILNTNTYIRKNSLHNNLLKKQFKSYYKNDSNINPIYTRLAEFLSKDEINRRKEIYYFIKSSNKTINKEPIIGEWLIDDKYLSKNLNKTHLKINQLIDENRLHEALDSIGKIVRNNDERLDSEVSTLKYKLDQTNDKLEKSVTIDEDLEKEKLVKTKQQISDLSKSVIKEISNNGFYLVHLPERKEVKESLPSEKTIILFASADAVDQSRLRLDEEYREIEFELMQSKHRDDYELIPCLASRISDLQKKLLNHKPQIIHFSGHGTCTGICLIGKEGGKASIVSNEPLAELFKLFSQYITCIFLNSCHSISQSHLLSQYISKVICMKNTVKDETAIHFASSFYAALASGYDIDFSFDFAKNSIELNKLSGSDIPLLLTKIAI
ncbi:hypothetical protein GGR92_000888 [Spirosoma lacussanchae]|uniref:caspase family protein n=1 Tax=Spirosoma lacussanchae TaxID=1884249 RepID=UPI0011097CF6|nr:caspase family protein [Spirosoma lacussanchae]